MEPKKMILIAYGTTIATSALVAGTLQDTLLERGISVNTRKCKVSEVRDLSKEADLIVTTIPVPENLKVPVIHTLAFLTGVGTDEVIDQIVSILKN